MRAQRVRTTGLGRRLATVLALASVPAALGWLLLQWPLAAGLETRYGLDLLVKLRGRQQPPPEMCVVAVDDASAIELGLDPLDPWPRQLHADLIRLLDREGARAIAFDVLFEGERDPAQDLQLELALFDSGRAVIGATVERIDDPRFRQARLIEPYGPFAESAAAVAEVELPTDADGVIRRAWLFFEDRPSLALAAYEVATGDDLYRRERGSRRIDYYGPPRTVPTVSFYQALDPAQFLPEGFFRDRIVFVGASQVAAAAASAVKDSFPTPFSGETVGYTYGVEIHATIAGNLLEGRSITVLPLAVETLLVLALSVLSTGAFLTLRPLLGALALVTGIVAVWLAAYAAFVGSGVWLPAVIPSVVLLPAAYVVGLLWYYLTTVRDREKIRRAFAFYLSPEMIRKIAEQPDSLRLGGDEIVGTAVFTDIQGFTQIAEKMNAADTAAMLNEYFSAITGRIFDTGGTLIKYIGDAVFAIWGAPLPMVDHATRACHAAIDMSSANRREDGSPASGLVTRIGVHTGSMLVGNLGSEQRFDYTAIGDTVNLAARLESLNKQFGTRVLVSAETLAQSDGSAVTRCLGRVRVAGRAEPVVLHELVGLEGGAADLDRETIDLFEEAVEHYRRRQFDRATEGFRNVRERCRGDDGPSSLYLELIAGLEDAPPAADWDGVIRFSKK